MSCQICIEPFDHSFHEPYQISCPHTFCLTCVNKFKTCPICRTDFDQKNVNLALLNFIEKSNYDNLKDISIKTYIEIQELKKNLTSTRLINLKIHEDNLKIIKNLINVEADNLITLLKNNQTCLINECNEILNDIQSYLTPDNYENNELIQINNTQESIQNNEINEKNLIDFNKTLIQIKSQINLLQIQIRNYSNKYNFDRNNNIFDAINIGSLQTVS